MTSPSDLINLHPDILIPALREGLEDLVTIPGVHSNPAIAIEYFDKYKVYPTGVDFRDRACRIGQDLRLSVIEIDILLSVLFRSLNFT